MKQASRPYVRRHARPRDAAGRYLPSRQLWTREDGQTRWIRFLEPDRERQTRGFDLNEDALRHLVVLVFVVIVAALMAFLLR